MPKILYNRNDMEEDKKSKKLTIERVVCLVAGILIASACVSEYFSSGDIYSIIPNSRIVDMIIHGICASCCFFFVFKPVFPMIIGVCLVESFVTMNITYEQLGVFLFYVSYILLYCKGYLVKNYITKTLILSAYHIICIACVWTHGPVKFCITLGSSAMFCVFYIWVYDILKAKLSCIFPVSVSNNPVIKNKQPGSKVFLSEYGLTERQINMILDNLQNNLSYKELSEKYYVSISTVKKDFSEVFQVFNVGKLEELHLLLLSYQVLR